MPRRKGICIDCNAITSRNNVLRCKKCSGIKLRKNPEIDRKQYCRNWYIKKKYGLEPIEFEAYWIACYGKCFICEKNMEMPTKTRGQGLDVCAIDHNHQTGNVRGLLCNACNKGLGFFKDDARLIQKALNYLTT
jgi:hypothetical protein